MPLVYRAIANGTHVVPGTPAGIDNEMRQTPGGRIMLAQKPKNFTQLFRAYVDGYRTIWAWNPGPKTPSGAEVLDGVAAFGQCASFVRGLYSLATAKAPYGLNLGAQVEIVRYNGQFNDGFLSPHNGVHFGLASNVLTTGGASPPVFAPLYYWANHYVIKYLGRYFDPSYDDEYATLDEMAAYQIKAGQHQRGTDIYEAVQDRMGNITYFKQHRGAVGARIHAVEGPFASLP